MSEVDILKEDAMRLYLIVTLTHRLNDHHSTVKLAQPERSAHPPPSFSIPPASLKPPPVRVTKKCVSVPGESLEVNYKLAFTVMNSVLEHMQHLLRKINENQRLIAATTIYLQFQTYGMLHIFKKLYLHINGSPHCASC